MSITLAQLKTQARQRADLEDNDFVTDSELTGYINNSLAELYDLLIAAYDGDYYIESVDFTTTSGVENYALPNGTNYSAAKAIYKLKGVDAKIVGNSWFSLKPFNFNERNRNSDYSWGLLNGPTVRYRMVGSNLRFNPAPNSAIQVRVWYVPVAPVLTADSDTFEDLNAWSEYVVIDAAIKCKIKEDLDFQALQLQKESIAKRIREMAQNRDAGKPESISDVYAENDDYYFSKA